MKIELNKKYDTKVEFDTNLDNNELTYDGKVIKIGLKKVDAEKIRRAASLALKKVLEIKQKEFQIKVPKLDFLDNAVVNSIVEGLLLSNYKFSKYKKQEKIKAVSLITKELNIKTTKIICEATNYARDLVNEIPSVKSTEYMESEARKIAKKLNLKITVLKENDLSRLGMNLLLSVGRSARTSPRLVIIEYLPNDKQPVIICGKGIVFDAGGMNLKPTNYIENMKLDMAGSAAVLGTIKAAAELKLNKNIIAVVPLAENAIGPNSYYPGDIIKSYRGLTVEVLNTDAEGRLILADALAYSVDKYNPKYVIDIATLTGSCLVTFGEFCTGLVSNDDALSEKLYKASLRTYERVWRLPLFDEYQDSIKGDVSDIKNIGYKRGKYAGCITAGAFLERFIKDTPWAHLDIAGAAFWEESRFYTPKGGTGAGVRLLVNLFQND